MVAREGTVASMNAVAQVTPGEGEDRAEDVPRAGSGHNRVKPVTAALAHIRGRAPGKPPDFPEFA